MRYRSRCRARTVRRCDTKGDPAAAPGPTAPGSACPALAMGHTCTLCPGWDVIPWLGCSALAGMSSHGWDVIPWLGCYPMAGMLCPGRDVIPWLGCSALAGMLCVVLMLCCVPRMSCVLWEPGAGSAPAVPLSVQAGGLQQPVCSTAAPEGRGSWAPFLPALRLIPGETAQPGTAPGLEGARDRGCGRGSIWQEGRTWLLGSGD